MKSAAHRLREKYRDATAAGTLGGADVFFALAAAAISIADETAGPKRAIAFTLFAIFERLARKHDGVAITVEEGRLTYSALHDPVTAALAVLEPGADCDILATILALIDAQAPPPKRS